METTLLDITDLEAVRRLVKEQGVQCIVNCAAYTNVDKAETDEAFCRTLNAKAPQNLAIAMKEVNGLLVHVSTDYVFGGDPYNTLAAKTSREPRQESMDRPSSKERSSSASPDAIMSSCAQPGSIPSSARTS